MHLQILAWLMLRAVHPEHTHGDMVDMGLTTPSGRRPPVSAYRQTAVYTLMRDSMTSVYCVSIVSFFIQTLKSIVPRRDD